MTFKHRFVFAIFFEITYYYKKRSCHENEKKTASDPESQVQRLRREAIDQANRYASSDLVQSTKGHTTLHKLNAVFHGMDMAVCEEI